MYRILLNISTNEAYVNQILKEKKVEELLVPRILSKKLSDEEVEVTLNLVTNLILGSKSFMKTLLNSDEQARILRYCFSYTFCQEKCTLVASGLRFFTSLLKYESSMKFILGNQKYDIFGFLVDNAKKLCSDTMC